jgi:hypothetical protein
LRPHLSGREKINLSTVFAGQAVGIKEVQDDIWLVSFMDYDLGYFDLETRMLEPMDHPFGPSLSPCVAGTFCNPCLRVGQSEIWWPGTELNRRRQPFQGRLPNWPSGLESADVTEGNDFMLVAI